MSVVRHELGGGFTPNNSNPASHHRFDDQKIDNFRSAVMLTYTLLLLSSSFVSATGWAS